MAEVSAGRESCPANQTQLGEFRGSQIEYYGSDSSSCGYCKGEHTRHSYDMRLIRMQPEDYQELLDINWRRSGTYCYHPLNWSTCCPNYGISCKTDKFCFTASQRRVIENLNSYIYTGSTSERIKLDYSRTPTNYKYQLKSDCDRPQVPLTKKDLQKLAESTKAKDRRFLKACERTASKLEISLEAASKKVKEKNIRRRNNYNKSTLEQYLFPAVASFVPAEPGGLPSRPRYKLKIRLFHAQSKEARAVYNEEHQLLIRYQQAIHKEDSKEWTLERFNEFLVRSPLVAKPMDYRDYVRRVDDGRDDSDDEFEYDVADENLESLSQPCNVAGNRHYLIVEPPELPTCYGSYHCTYRLDGRLIGVGVLDVLPKCITTVYFFYDPDYQFLKLGIYSALVEISMVRRIHNHYIANSFYEDKLVHYYLGFYVHVCKKMHYKTSFKPSYLLDCVSYRYMPTESCLPKLRLRKYARFYFDVNDFLYTPTPEEILQMPVISPVSPYMITMGKYFEWVEINLSQDLVTYLVNDILIPYLRLVGKKLGLRMLFRVKYLHRGLLARHASESASRRR